MKYEILSDDAIIEALENHPRWLLSEDKKTLRCVYKFKNFIQAMAFMNACATFAEEINHHPNWSNVYNKVDVHLTTHSEKALTNLDADMVDFMDKAFKSLI